MKFVIKGTPSGKSEADYLAEGMTQKQALSKLRSMAATMEVATTESLENVRDIMRRYINLARDRGRVHNLNFLVEDADTGKVVLRARYKVAGDFLELKAFDPVAYQAAGMRRPATSSPAKQEGSGKKGAPKSASPRGAGRLAQLLTAAGFKKTPDLGGWASYMAPLYLPTDREDQVDGEAAPLWDWVLQHATREPWPGAIECELTVTPDTGRLTLRDEAWGTGLELEADRDSGPQLWIALLARAGVEGLPPSNQSTPLAAPPAPVARKSPATRQKPRLTHKAS